MNGGTYIRGGLYIFSRVFGELINGEAYIPGGVIHLCMGF